MALPDTHPQSPSTFATNNRRAVATRRGCFVARAWSYLLMATEITLGCGCSLGCSCGRHREGDLRFGGFQHGQEGVRTSEAHKRAKFGIVNAFPAQVGEDKQGEDRD